MFLPQGLRASKAQLALLSFIVAAARPEFASAATIHGTIQELFADSSTLEAGVGRVVLYQGQAAIDSVTVDPITATYEFVSVGIATYTIVYESAEGYASYGSDRSDANVLGSGDELVRDFLIMAWGRWGVSTNVDGPGVVLIGPHVISGPLVDAGTHTSWWVLAYSSEDPGRGIGCPGIPSPQGNAFLTIPYKLDGPSKAFNGVLVGLRPFSSPEPRAMTLLPHGTNIDPIPDPAAWLASHPPSNGLAAFHVAGTAESTQVESAIPGMRYAFESAGPAQLNNGLVDAYFLTATPDSATRLDVQVPIAQIRLFDVDDAYGPGASIQTRADAATQCFHGSGKLYNCTTNGILGTILAQEGGNSAPTPAMEVRLRRDGLLADSTMTDSGQFWFGDLAYPHAYTVEILSPAGFTVDGADTASMGINSDRFRWFPQFAISRPDVSTGPTQTIPEGISLRAVGPNPFQSSTKVAIALPSKSTVRLSLFDVAGRETLRLTARSFDAGEHVISLDAKTSDGKTLGPGVYVLRLQAEPELGSSVRTTLKLIITR